MKDFQEIDELITELERDPEGKVRLEDARRRLRTKYSDRRFEDALIALARATDGSGSYIILYRGDNSWLSLRKATIAFAERVCENTEFIALPEGESKLAEVAYWRNLALLATATEAALEFALSGT